MYRLVFVSACQFYQLLELDVTYSLECHFNKCFSCFLVFSSVDVRLEAGKCVKIKIKTADDLGELELGKLDQEYIKDPDLRELLDMTTLDGRKMESLEGQKLRLAYSVIYSEKFVLKGKREHEVFTSTTEIICR